MNSTYFDPIVETMDREALPKFQLDKLHTVLGEVLNTNTFYQSKLNAAGIKEPADITTMEDYLKLPFTTKEELSSDQLANPPFGTNVTLPQSSFVRIHQTSGTKGEPLRWMDTDESWDWWARCWAAVYAASGVTSDDRIFFAFSFGPFIGFWSSHEGAKKIGALSIPGGGMSSLQRLNAILGYNATVLVCTPTYALHLAEVADSEGVDIANSSIRTTIHAGEPGANLPATKHRIETAWGASCFDHAGATEVGAWGFECQFQEGLHLNEGEFICEVINPETFESADEGELVITNLGRVGMPVIRYRTGDRVKLDRRPCECGRTSYRLEGGVVGRIDDAMIIRGVNVFPSAIENLVRRFPEVGEFSVDVYNRSELDQMNIRLEVVGTEPDKVAAAVSREIRNGLGIRVDVKPVPFGTLPRFDLKARRFVDHR